MHPHSPVLSDTEKELGVVLVDIGGGTTDVAVFVEGALSYSSVIPIGAINITKDLAAGLRISLESAEKIKLLLGQTPKIPALSDEEERAKVDQEQKKQMNWMYPDLGLPEELRILSRKTLTEGIIKPRLNEIFTMVALELKAKRIRRYDAIRSCHYRRRSGNGRSSGIAPEEILRCPYISEYRNA